MVIQKIIFFKIPLICTGGDNGFVLNPYRCNRGSSFVERFLDADVKWASVQFAADSKHVSTKIDQGVPDAFAF